MQKHVTTLHIKLCAKAKNKASGCGAVGSALPWGNYDRKVNSWPLRPPLRSYQWYGNQRVCPPGNHLSVRYTKWRANCCYATKLNLLRDLLRNEAHEYFLSPFCYTKPVRITLIIWQKMNLWPLLSYGRGHKFKFWHALGWSGVPRSELAELWGFHGCAPQVQVLSLR